MSADGKVDAAGVTETYLRLLDEVSPGTVTRPVMESMLESGDPFTLPEDKGSLSPGLKKSLAELKRILDVHFSGDFPYSANLLDALRTRTAGVDEAKARQTKAVGENVWDHREFEFKGSLEGLPDKVNDFIVGFEKYNELRTGQPRIAGRLEFIGLDGKHTDRPLASPVELSNYIVNPTTAEILFIQENMPHTILRGKLLDETGQPNQVVSLEAIPGKISGIPENAQPQGLVLSPDGTSLLFSISFESFVLPLTGAGPKEAISLGSSAGLSGGRVNYGFLGNDFAWIKRNGRFVAVSTKTPSKAIPLGGEAVVSVDYLDGVNLVAVQKNVNEKQAAISFFEMSGGKKVARGSVKVQRGGYKSIQGNNWGSTDNVVVPIPDSKYFAVVMLGNIGNGSGVPGEGEIQFWDPEQSAPIGKTRFFSRSTSRKVQVTREGELIMSADTIIDQEAYTKVGIWNIRSFQKSRP